MTTEVLLAATGFGRKWVRVLDLADASRKVRTFIEENDLGSSRWTGGDLRRANVLIGHVSYNGRVELSTDPK